MLTFIICLIVFAGITAAYYFGRLDGNNDCLAELTALRTENARLKEREGFGYQRGWHDNGFRAY